VFEPESFENDDDDQEDPFQSFINDDLDMDELGEPPPTLNPFTGRRPESPDNLEEPPFGSSVSRPGFGGFPRSAPPFGSSVSRPESGEPPQNTPLFGSRSSTPGSSRYGSGSPSGRPFTSPFASQPPANDPRWRLGSYQVSEPVPIVRQPGSSLPAFARLMPRRGWFQRLAYYIPEAKPGWTAVRVGRHAGYVEADQVQFTPFRWTALVDLVERIKKMAPTPDTTIIMLMLMLGIALYIMLVLQISRLDNLQAQVAEMQATLSALTP